MGSLVTTWGTCRTAIGNGGTGLSVNEVNNMEWSSGFYTTEGNGFVRVDPFNRSIFVNTYVLFDTPSSIFTLSYMAAIPGVITMDQSEADELIGQNVDLTGPDTFAITSDYLTISGQSVTTTGYAPITAIGYLTAF